MRRVAFWCLVLTCVATFASAAAVAAERRLKSSQLFPGQARPPAAGRPILVVRAGNGITMRLWIDAPHEQRNEMRIAIEKSCAAARRGGLIQKESSEAIRRQVITKLVRNALIADGWQTFGVRVTPVRNHPGDYEVNVARLEFVRVPITSGVQLVAGKVAVGPNHECPSGVL